MLGVRTWVCSALSAAALLAAAVALGSRSQTEPLIPRATLYLTRSHDLTRYRAYSNAALGLPYLSYYVRTEAAWRRAFLIGEHLPDDASPTITPDHPLKPYRDYLVEYPPGFFLAALPPAVITRSETGYGIAFELIMTALFVGAAMCCGRLAPYLGATVRTWHVLGWSVLAAAALGIISVQRYDAVVAFLLCVMCLASVRRKAIVLGVAAGAIIAVKLVPGVVAVLCAMYFVRRRRPGDAIAAAVVAVATVLIVALPVAYAAGSTIDRVMWYHLDRPLEIESTVAGLLGLWHSIDPSSVSFIFSFGSNNVVGPLVTAGMWVSNLATAIGLLLVYVVAWRELQLASEPAAQARVLAGAAILALVVLIALGKVSSPQYFTWLIPLGTLMTLIDGRGVTMAWFIGSMALAQIVFPTAMHAVIQFAPWACALVVGRNLALLGWALRLRQRAWRL
jgi:hypothetical protein